MLIVSYTYILAQDNDAIVAIARRCEVNIHLVRTVGVWLPDHERKRLPIGFVPPVYITELYYTVHTSPRWYLTRHGTKNPRYDWSCYDVVLQVHQAGCTKRMGVLICSTLWNNTLARTGRNRVKYAKHINSNAASVLYTRNIEPACTFTTDIDTYSYSLSVQYRYYYCTRSSIEYHILCLLHYQKASTTSTTTAVVVLLFVCVIQGEKSDCRGYIVRVICRRTWRNNAAPLASAGDVGYARYIVCACCMSYAHTIRTCTDAHFLLL